MSITVDFNQYTLSHAGEDPASALLAWLRASPRSSRVHVVLQPPCFDAAARKLQYALQSLGCTVTRRMPMPAALQN